MAEALIVVKSDTLIRWYRKGFQVKLSPSIDGDSIPIFHEKAATTGVDSFVQFRSSGAISAGDIFVTTGYPAIDLKNGGSIQGVLNGLNHILDLAIPDYWMEGGTWIIPGAGRLSDSADVACYRDMLTIIRDRVADMIGKNVTLDQVEAARPTRLTIRVTAATRAHGLPRCSSKLSIAVSGPENRPP